MEAKAAEMFQDAKGIETMMDKTFIEDSDEADKLRGTSITDAVSIRRGAELERSNQMADSRHLREIAMLEEKAADDKKERAREESQDAAEVEGEMLQDHARQLGDARALRFLAEKEKRPVRA